MEKSRKRRSLVSANARIPEGLGSLLTAEVMNLDSDLKTAHLKSEFLTKFVSSDTDPPSVRRQRAINKWLATERANEGTNDRLINTHPDFQILRDVKMVDFVSFLQETVRDVIGDTVPEAALVGSFSGGASTSRNRTESHPAFKYLGKAHVTKEALVWVDIIRDTCPGWSSFWGDLHLEVVPGNVMFTVPKKTDIDRCACKEPDINMFLQKGAGRIIRHALREHGIDLNDQSRNRSLARKGSIDGSLATVDLSSASDSVSIEFVRMALPALWFDFLDSTRSRLTAIDGEEHVNQMFSSMGNGFTFELESLLFYALARTTAYFTGTRGIISVYGDDIIIPSSMFHDLEWVLSWFGFEVNTSKSFFEGSFRESCGGHFINGRDVTPFYVKEPISTLSDLIKFANALRRWSLFEDMGTLDPSAYDLWSFAASFVPKRFWGSNDWDSRYELCSPGLPDSRLFPVTAKTATGTGGYIHWLNATVWREEQTSVQTSEASQPSDRPMIVRRAIRTVDLDKALFYQEECHVRVTSKEVA